MPNDEIVNVRYMVQDVDEAIAFYTKLLDFEVLTSAAPAFAALERRSARPPARCLSRSPWPCAWRPRPWSHCTPR